jgi:nucleoside 2-deoxyribosyltransferase
MNVYIGCALTAVPRSCFNEYTAFIHELAEALRSSGCQNVKYALIDSDPQLADKPREQRARLCYVWDREMVEQADALIVDATFPAIGVGVELQIAAAKAIPVVLSFNRALGNRWEPVQYENPDHSKHELQIGEGFISLMALGIPTIFRIIQYVTPNDGIADIVEAISLLRKG